LTNCISVVSLLDLLQHARALAKGQSDAWAMLDGAGEDVLRLGETIASIERAIDRHAVAGPFLDLVELRSSA
jgi:hypothetical protein